MLVPNSFIADTKLHHFDENDYRDRIPHYRDLFGRRIGVLRLCNYAGSKKEQKERHDREDAGKTLFSIV